jgi:putative DNA primase/helicase
MQPRFPLNDSGNGERFAAMYAGQFLYIAPQRKWYRWTRTHWEADASGSVQFAAKNCARSILNDAAREDDDKARKATIAFANASESKRARDAMLACASFEPEMAFAPDRFDRDPMSFNCTSGTVNLVTGACRPHAERDYISKVAPVTFDARATCPTWDRFLATVTGGDVDLVSYLQRAVGYTLTGSVREHVLLFLYGDGRNGKSTFLRVLQTLFGPYGMTGASDLLLATPGNQHPTAIADLQGRRLIVCSEIEAGRTFNEARVKQTTGGDRLSARRMREDFWEFEPSHKTWIAANHKPVIRGADEGIWRRIVLLPFTVAIPEADVDPELYDKLATELPGILNWAIEGCLAWQRDGLRPPAAVTDAVKEYREESSRFAEFFDERCLFNATAKGTTVAAMYAAYERFARSRGEKEPANKDDLRMALTSKPDVFTTKGTGGARSWIGVKLSVHEVAVNEAGETEELFGVPTVAENDASRHVS